MGEDLIIDPIVPLDHWRSILLLFEAQSMVQRDVYSGYPSNTTQQQKKSESKAKPHGTGSGRRTVV